MRRLFIPASLLPLAVVAALLTSCGNGDGNAEGGPVFAEDYQNSYTEVRDCRPSADHDLMNIRILADEAALGPYQSRDEPFPEGAVVLKEQYDTGDVDCEGDIQLWTVMQKLAEGSAEDTGDWHWQTVDAERAVINEDLPRCVACHTGCGVSPDGYMGTCAVP